jgi:type IV secretion system protein VirB10
MTDDNRFAVDNVPDPSDIDRAPVAERENRIPAIAGSAMEPKKVMVVAAVGGGILFLGLTLLSSLGGGDALPPVKAKPALSALQYDPNSVIAPTLATAPLDPNAPIALTGEQVPAVGASGPPQVQPQYQPQPQTRQRSDAEVLREASRRSTLIAYGGERQGSGGAYAGTQANYGEGEGEPATAARAPAREPTNLDTLRRASAIGQASARVLGDRNYLITAGTFIPCVLQTAMDSSQPGFVSCIIPRDVYSENGRVVLMEKGTKVFGEYQGGLNRGQYRLFVLWNRAVTPRGIAVDVSSPASDSLGRSGVGGRVNNFFWQRFGTALLFSLVEDASTVATQAVGNAGSNTTKVPSDAASTILQDSQQIKPVLRKNQGEDVGISVAQDFDFSSVYGLRLK